MRNNSKRNQKKVKKTTPKIVMVIPVLFLLLCLSTIFALVNSVNEKIVSGVTVNKIDVSKLTINEAYQKLKDKLTEQISKNIVVNQGDYETTISLQQLEVNYDIVEAVNESYNIGRNNNILISNYQILKSSLFHTDINKKIDINEEELNKIIDDIASKIPGIEVDSSYYIEGENLVISNGKKGIQVKKEELKSQIIEAISNQISGKDIETLEIPIEEKEPEKINIEKIREEIYQEPKDAYYEEEPFKIYKEIEGIDLKITIEEANEILKEEKDEYVIPLTITKPKVTINDLKNLNLFPDQISKYTTRYDESNVNRSTNIKLSSDKINGSIIMPGEVFSYNKTVGERTIKAGYKEAAIYMGGKVVDGIGGGICQVSSTLYNAVLEANLEIVSRKNHYFITSYVSASRDATVSYGTIDFKFKNTRNYPIKIECESQNGICQIAIYGIKEETEYKVVIEDEITDIIPYTTKYIETKELKEGEEKEIQKGVNGYKSEAYRILELNGQIVSKSLLSKDSYNPLQRIVEKGIK